jgi:hypothetical protein
MLIRSKTRWQRRASDAHWLRHRPLPTNSRRTTKDDSARPWSSWTRRIAVRSLQGWVPTTLTFRAHRLAEPRSGRHWSSARRPPRGGHRRTPCREVAPDNRSRVAAVPVIPHEHELVHGPDPGQVVIRHQRCQGQAVARRLQRSGMNSDYQVVGASRRESKLLSLARRERYVRSWRDRRHGYIFAQLVGGSTLDLSDCRPLALPRRGEAERRRAPRRLPPWTTCSSRTAGRVSGKRSWLAGFRVAWNSTAKVALLPLPRSSGQRCPSGRDRAYQSMISAARLVRS